MAAGREKPSLSKLYNEVKERLKSLEQNFPNNLNVSDVRTEFDRLSDNKKVKSQALWAVQKDPDLEKKLLMALEAIKNSIDHLEKEFKGELKSVPKHK